MALPPTASDVLALVGKLSLQVDQLVTAQTTRDTETRRRLDRLQDVVEALRARPKAGPQQARAYYLLGFC